MATVLLTVLCAVLGFLALFCAWLMLVNEDQARWPTLGAAVFFALAAWGVHDLIEVPPW